MLAQHRNIVVFGGLKKLKFGIWGVHRFECHQGPPGPGAQIESCCLGPGNSWDSGVSANLPASKEAESPSPQIPYHTPPPPCGYYWFSGKNKNNKNPCSML